MATLELVWQTLDFQIFRQLQTHARGDSENTQQIRLHRFFISGQDATKEIVQLKFTKLTRDQRTGN